MDSLYVYEKKGRLLFLRKTNDFVAWQRRGIVAETALRLKHHFSYSIFIICAYIIDNIYNYTTSVCFEQILKTLRQCLEPT